MESTVHVSMVSASCTEMRIVGGACKADGAPN